MKSLLYLTAQQKQLLEQQGYTLDNLSLSELKDVLLLEDYKSICKATVQLCSTSGILHTLGVEITKEWDDELRYEANLPSGFVFQSPTTESMPTDVVLCATVGKGEILYVYPEQSNFIDNDMYKHSRLKILAALTKIMIFKQLKLTKIFQTAFVEGR